MAAISASMVKELRERTSLGMMDCKKALVAADGNIEQAIEDLRKSSGMKAAKKAGRIAAKGVVFAKVAADNSFGVLVEVNSETDFAARDEGFLAFVTKVTDAAFAAKQCDMAALMQGELSDAREALVQKIGENITPRRIVMLEAANVAAYVHSNNKVATLIALTAGESELAKNIAMHVTATNPRVISREDMTVEEVDKEKEIIKAQPDMAGRPDAIVDKMMIGRISKFLAENSLTEQPFVKNPDEKISDLLKAVSASVTAFNRLEVGEGIEVEEVDFAADIKSEMMSENNQINKPSTIYKYILVVGYFWFPIIALFKDSLDPSFGQLILAILFWFYVVGFDLLPFFENVKDPKHYESLIIVILVIGRLVACFIFLLLALKIVGGWFSYLVNG